MGNTESDVENDVEEFHFPKLPSTVLKMRDNDFKELRLSPFPSTTGFDLEEFHLFEKLPIEYIIVSPPLENMLTSSRLRFKIL